MVHQKEVAANIVHIRVIPSLDPTITLKPYFSSSLNARYL
jgi:hypothetical protein